MFQITCFVKDTKLAEVLRVLDELVYDLKIKTYVAPDKDGKKPKKAKAVSTGSIPNKMERAIAAIRTWNPESNFQIHDLRHITDRPTATRAVMRLVKLGEVEKVGFGVYRLKAPLPLSQME